MPRPVARITDIGVGFCYCCCEPMMGTIITGDPTHLDTMMPPQARITDTVLGFCGHPGFIVTGDPQALDLEMLPYAHIGDFFTGCFCGSIVTGDLINIDGAA